jgi:hypothetical protein
MTTPDLRIDGDAAIVANLTMAADSIDPHPDRPGPDREHPVAVPAHILAGILRDAAGMYAAVADLFPGEADDRAAAATCDPCVQLADHILDGWTGR